MLRVCWGGFWRVFGSVFEWCLGLATPMDSCLVLLVDILLDFPSVFLVVSSFSMFFLVFSKKAVSFFSLPWDS